MGGWGCPHEVNGKCQKVNNLPCEPGMKGCVLFARYRQRAEVAQQEQGKAAGGGTKQRQRAGKTRKKP